MDDDSSPRRREFARCGSIAVKFVHPARHRGQFCSVLLLRERAYIRGADGDRDNKTEKRVMQRLATKLTLTASLAALIFATPVSIDLSRSNATDGAHTAGIFSLTTAQAHPERDATARNAGDRQGAGAHQRTANDAKAADVRANNGRANGVRANDVRADNAKVNNANINNAQINNANVNNVKVNNANVNNVNAAYVRPPYVRPYTTGVAVAGTAVAVGTTVAVLPASCTTVVYDDVTYHHCGSTYSSPRTALMWR
jgi:hypothetical protein